MQSIANELIRTATDGVKVQVLQFMVNAKVPVGTLRQAAKLISLREGLLRSADCF
jgi:hypothetical protein